MISLPGRLSLSTFTCIICTFFPRRRTLFRNTSVRSKVCDSLFICTPLPPLAESQKITNCCFPITPIVQFLPTSINCICICCCCITIVISSSSSSYLSSSSRTNSSSSSLLPSSSNCRSFPPSFPASSPCCLNSRHEQSHQKCKRQQKCERGSHVAFTLVLNSSHHLAQVPM